MNVKIEFSETKEIEIPIGVFLKKEYGRWYYAVLAEDLIVQVGPGTIFRQCEFSRYDEPLEMVQITRTEFQKAFGETFRSMQQFHSMIQAAPEFVSNETFKKEEVKSA